MKLEILPAARAEAGKATAYYKKIDPALGEQFSAEFASTAQSLLSQSLLRRVRPEGYRRVNLPIFPYYLAYVVRGELVTVIALKHTASKPDDLRARLRRL